MQLADFMAELKPTAESVRACYADKPDRGEHILNLLGTAASHLDAARLGQKLYSLPHAANQASHDLFVALDEGHVTLEAAANNLVFRGVVTSFDLCAAAVWRHLDHGAVLNREPDLGDWKTHRAGRLRSANPDSVFVGWIDAVIADRRWQLLKEGRHKLTHRMVPRIVTSGAARDLSAGPPFRTGSTRIRLLHEEFDLIELYPALLQFGVDCWVGLNAMFRSACARGSGGSPV